MNTHRPIHSQQAHPGFASAAKSIQSREGISANRARAILAAASRNASKRAKAVNPRLRRIKG